MTRKCPDRTTGDGRRDARALENDALMLLADVMALLPRAELRAQMLGALGEESERVVG